MMKTIFAIIMVVFVTGCASTQPQTSQVSWPASCGPEPQSFSRFTHDNHRRDIIYDICERVNPGNYRTARSAAFQSYLADMQVYRNTRSIARGR